MAPKGQPMKEMPAFEIEDLSQVKMRSRGSRNSIYAGLLTELKKLKPPKGLILPTPRGESVTQFKQRLAGSLSRHAKLEGIRLRFRFTEDDRLSVAIRPEDAGGDEDEEVQVKKPKAKGRKSA